MTASRPSRLPSHMKVMKSAWCSRSHQLRMAPNMLNRPLAPGRVKGEVRGPSGPAECCLGSRNRRQKMSKIKWLLAALGVALVSLVPVLGASAPAGADPGTILKFTTMTPVTGPYVGTANPIRMVPGGGLPWIITAGNGALKSDGHLRVHVRGLVLANQAPVPPALQGTNPIPDFEAIVSCQTISATGAATITNVSTAPFPASTAGNSDINATVSLPHPCIAPVVFVFGAPNVGWFAATGG